MPRPVPAGLATMLGATVLLSVTFARAQQAAPAPAPQAGAPAPDTAKAGKPAAETGENKAMAAYKAFFDAKLAGLHAGLELTPAQGPLWAPVEAAIRDMATAHRTMHRGASDASTDDALHRLQRMSDRLVKNGQAIKALTDATGPLVASLDADQKDRLPRLLEGMQPGRVLRAAFDIEGDRREAMNDERGRDDHRRPGFDRRGDDRRGDDREGDDLGGNRRHRRDRDEAGDERRPHRFHGGDWDRDGGERGDRHGAREDHYGAYQRHQDDDEDFGGRPHGPDGFRRHDDGGHHQDAEDERT